MAREKGVCLRKDHGRRKVEISCSQLELAVAASQTSSSVGVVPVSHICFNDDDSLSECFMVFCISTYHEHGNPITFSSAVVGI